ncbi:hypothetical protein [Kamptonema sp. UHCC 0994]|uniref:hypothetical protein n=1 Tax=Kamptonema sp. UHCC 0994 TaxID=3031329 RepID=UPI0023B905A3|nr:hypothetical protein [Kamptonema sp. UHCC 0994]MDF0555418.1 hypothetical protein [Kamptonema sp. UHCC 0994]
MSKHSSVESPDKLSSNQIKPALQAVMGCLDINLEEEVSQYRRQRQRSQQWVAPSVSLGAKPASPSIDLISPAVVESSVEQGAVLSPEMKPRQTIHFETRSPASQLAIADNAAGKTLTSAGSDRLSAKSANSLRSPNNYLASSEELLKSLDEGKSEAQAERSLTASLFTPLGLSSMLLFLLSCIALGYTVINPSILANLGFNRWLKQSSPTPAASPANIPTADSANQAELPKAPNLASKEFVELDLSTLSNVKPTPIPIPLPSAKPSIPPTPKPVAGVSLPNVIPPQPANAANTNDESLNNLSRALLPKRSATSVVPRPLAPIPSTAKPTASPAATPKPVVSNPGIPVKAQDGYYYVVLDYSNEQSLEEARTAVTDAYVREFPNGVKIQMGALDNPRSAERLVKELQEKGVAARYYQP